MQGQHPHTNKKGDRVTISIDGLAFGGEGVGRIQNGEKPLVVFVEDTVPGDIVEIEIGTKKRNFARGFVRTMVQASSERVKPRCEHFGTPPQTTIMDKSKGCGGCVWQFLDVSRQHFYKEQQVRDALKRIGGIHDEVVLPIVGGDPWYYRNKMEFSFHKDPGGELNLGLHVRRRHYDVIELTECYLLEPFIGDLVTKVREFFRQLDHEKKIDPEMRLYSFTVRVGKNTGELMMILSAENGQENFMEELKVELLKFCAEKKLGLDSLYYLDIRNQKGTRTTITEHLIYGKATIEETLELPGNQVLRFEISPQAFFQPNTALAQVLYSKALEAAGLTGNETVFDLYCGTGTIGLFCSPQAKKVYGIELNESAVMNARANAERNKIQNAEFLVGDVQQILPTIKGVPDVVLVDPPRNGLMPKVVESLLEFGAKRLVYVSCNPTALARDAQLLLKGGYRLQSVQPVDQFPQTYHIECVALFVR